MLRGRCGALRANQKRIRARSLGALVMFGYALLFGGVGIAALTISTFDPTANPMAQWYAVGACAFYALSLIAGYCGTWFMLRGRK